MQATILTNKNKGCEFENNYQFEFESNGLLMKLEAGI
jgi:hypothetical protein